MEHFVAPLRLKWAYATLDHPDVEYRDVRPGEPALVDVAFTLERTPDRAIIESLDPPANGIPRVLFPGIYLLAVRLFADQHEPLDETFLLGVPQGWAELTIQSLAVASPDLTA
jgi:hypothetical protein